MKPTSQDIFSIRTESQLREAAIEVFLYQAAENPVYRQYLESLNRDPLTIIHLEDIPFMPVEFFKTHQVICGEEDYYNLFTSSGTTGQAVSRHFVKDVSIYHQSFKDCFSLFYGPVNQYCILALLPSYLERRGSSLIYMVDDLITMSGHPQSGFYLDNYDDLAATLSDLNQNGQKTILLGVTYALLDLIERYKFALKDTIIMETGGMKGKRREMIRAELHELLCEGFGVRQIHSEYGMTELLSQAYSQGSGIFHTPPWMKVVARDTNDPFTLLPHERTGGLCVIDLANIESCAFIATQDLVKTHADGSFEVLGRFDNSDIRGCNLMVE